MIRLNISQLALDTRIGVHAWEQQVTQTVYADITLTLNTAASTQSDDLNDTLDYTDLSTCLRETAANLQTQLIERLAQILIDTINEHFAKKVSFKSITLTLTKPAALAFAQGVSVTLNHEYA